MNTRVRAATSSEALPAAGGLPEPDLIHPDLVGPDLVRSGRVHEAAGPGRRVFAAMLAGRLAGPVLWIIEGREREMLCPQGLAPFLDPARLILARPAGAMAVLQVMEEALRSGAVPLVVAELAEAPGLTASRRLQLAAGTGGGRGLCLVPENRLCANAAETRWLCRPLPGAAPRQLWELTRNRRGRPGRWEVRPWPFAEPRRSPRDVVPGSDPGPPGAFPPAGEAGSGPAFSGSPALSAAP